MKILTCAYCGVEYEVPYRRGQRGRLYCSPQCGHRANREKHNPGGVRRGQIVSTSTTGAASELYVCADLLGKGYEVFRAESPHCSCDLIAHKDGQLLRVEVKTANVALGSGKLQYGTNWLDPTKYDVLALVIMSEARIVYEGLN